VEKVDIAGFDIGWRKAPGRGADDFIGGAPAEALDQAVKIRVGLRIDQNRTFGGLKIGGDDRSAAVAVHERRRRCWG